MTDTKFTPGPWRVEGGTTVVWGACNPDDLSNYGMGYPVTDCRITPISNSSWCQGPEYEEGYANAHLIAAAPEIYEASAPFDDLATQWAVDSPEWRDSDSVTVVVTIGALRAIKEARAKARGAA